MRNKWVCWTLPLLAAACDGTLSGMHTTRGTLPVTYPDKPQREVPAEARPHDEPNMIRAQHLLVMHRDSRGAPPTIVRNKGEARARAEEALSKIKQGANVDEIISKYSDEPGAAERAGDLGTFARKMMVKKFSEAAFKLKPGEVSDIVETEFGFHVIRRTE
jgi:peptidyl-prolyl cis-trans isomerase NIMA-interacting 1